jgi:hypothetical protein
MASSLFFTLSSLAYLLIFPNLNQLTMEELLYDSAPIALKIAPKLCSRGADKENSCAWYHGIWQYLKILGIVGSPWGQQEFFETNLQKFARTGDYKRVLISGASDYSMLALVLNAYRQEGIEPEITVVDRCETPLYLNRWYAEQKSTSIKTHAVNFLHYNRLEPFDLICTHSFMGYFSPDTRMALFANWQKRLRSGGKLVTVNRIRPYAKGRQGFSSSQAEDFHKKVQEAGRVYHMEEIEQWASVYTSQYQTHPVTSQDEILKLLQANGFTLDSSHVEDTTRGNPSGPSVSRQAMRISFVATRS